MQALRFRKRVIVTVLSLLTLAVATAVEANADAFLFTESSGAQTLTLTFASGGTVTLVTDMGEINPGNPNQGWWSPGETNSIGNSNYGVGSSAGEPDDHHDFFTFDLSNVSGLVVGATLNLQRFCGDTEPSCGGPGGPATLPFGLWDVTTDPFTLNQIQNNPNFAIYDDLGSGISYGTWNLPTSGNQADILNFDLNNDALNAINAAEGNYFSLGGAIPLGNIVPEPSSLVLLAFGLTGLAGIKRRN